MTYIASDFQVINPTGTTIDVKNYVISINIPVAISHYSLYLKVMDDWQTRV